MTNIPDSHRDLLDSQVATLSTIGSDGLPQSTIVWFLYDEGELKLSLNDHRLKTRNLGKRPQLSLLILDPTNPARYLAVRGTAQIDPDDDYVFAGKVNAKYSANVKDNDKPGESRVVVTINPSNVYAVDMSAGH
jgi:PPOX class probable F420-dependent enzyme